MILIVVLAKVVGNYNIGSEEIRESEKIRRNRRIREVGLHQKIRKIR